MSVIQSTNLVEVFSALGDKTRFRLLQLLKSNHEICVSELAAEIGISNAGVSQQLKILEHAGLVERQRMGQKICYQISDATKVNQKILSLLDD
jgi:predicted transcriptional regulator